MEGGVEDLIVRCIKVVYVCLSRALLFFSFLVKKKGTMLMVLRVNQKCHSNQLFLDYLR